MDPFDRAVETVVARCLGISAGEQVLVVCDEHTRDLGEGLRAAAAATGADAVLSVMDVRELDGEEPPAPVAGALAACDVFVVPTSRSLSHTRARKAATDAGARGATLPGVTSDILARLMDCDFEVLQRRSRALAGLLTEASEAHISCPAGTDLRLDLGGRRGIADDGDLTARGAFGNLPCGEGFVSPAGGEGVLLATSLAGVGIAQPPARLTVTSGELTAAEGPEGERLLSMLRGAGIQGTNLAELGIGTNERARLVGNVIEDEKILGTVHVAFGASAGIGGTVSVPVHLDCVVVRPTVEIDGAPVIEDGAFLLAA